MVQFYKHFLSLAAVACIATAPAFAQTDTPQHPEQGWDTANRIPSTYYEDLMTNNTDIKPGHCWTVQVEPNTETPGWYRFQPYTTITDYVPRIMQATDDTYVYINATDPDKVYVEEFEPYADDSEYDFVNLVPENGWAGGEGRYGTLKDDVIAFSPRSFAVYDAGYEIWYEISKNTGFKLVLNESSAKDYAVSVKVSTCTSYEEIAYKADAGNDVWDVKGIVVPGEFKPEYYQKAVEEGEIVDTEWRQYAPVSARGLYTVVVVGLDRNGNMVSCDYDFGFNVVDDDSKWVDAGTTSFTEDFCASRYIDIESATYDVTLQKHATIPGYFRIANPYASHPAITYPKYQADHSHAHYIYINATDLEKPYIEASPVGVNLGYGDIVVTSAAARLIDSGMTLDEAAATGVSFGSIDADNNLTFPAGALFISEKGRNKGDWSASAPAFSVKLPIASSGIETIVSAAGESEIFNIQGIRVTGKTTGLKGLHIVRQADGSVKKVVF